MFLLIVVENINLLFTILKCVLRFDVNECIHGSNNQFESLTPKFLIELDWKQRMKIQGFFNIPKSFYEYLVYIIVFGKETAIF